MSASCVSGIAAATSPVFCGELSEVNMAVVHGEEEAYKEDRDMRCLKKQMILAMGVTSNC